ncbi:MAG: DUF1080 domain-containing protein [Planctomycetaceae bacterium]|nr:DUF1080 domain-containing protein [Planctomycetaceae bacterium]
MIRSLLLFLVLCLPSASMAQTYTNLLDSADLHHWMKPDGKPVTEGWVLEPGGVLHLTAGGGNIITREKYGDFELWFEFRIGQKGNNGIKYRVAQYGKQWLGLEYQILDDAAFPKLTREHLTASLYDLVEPIPSETRLLSDDQFNVGKIRVEGNRIQHWINGQLTIDVTTGSDVWVEAVKNSKFHDREGFGLNQVGHLMLTDHKSPVWIRNMFIRRLDGCGCPPAVSVTQISSSLSSP